jgi:hypothetical protein
VPFSIKWFCRYTIPAHMRQAAQNFLDLPTCFG